MPFTIEADPRDVDDLIGPLRQLPQPATQAEAPPLLDTVAAGSRQFWSPGSAYERLIGNPDPDDPNPPPQNFDPFDHIQGYEHFADHFVEADTPGQVEGIKRRIDGELRDRAVLDRAGIRGRAAAFGMTLLDPTFLASLAVPELTIVRAGRVARALQAGLEGATVASAYEGVMQSTQELRSAKDSMFNIGAGALLSGALGALVRRVPKEELANLGADLHAEFGAPRSEVGAASAMPRTTIQQESFARGGQTVANVARRIPLAETDLSRVMRSESLEARRTLQELADVSPLLEKNFEGIATPISVETRVLRHEGVVADFADELNRLYKAHRADPRPVIVGTPALSREAFFEAVTQAARRGDRDVFPHVSEGARYMRERVFNPLKAAAQRLRLLPKDVEVVGAESYVMRLYDRQKIRANRGEWDELLTQYFEAQDRPRNEARAVAEDVTRTILGTDRGLANFDAAFGVPDAGPLQERVLAIRDELIEKFLENDPVKVASRYVRSLGPQVEVVKHFGDKDMSGAFQRIRDEFDILRERARNAGGDVSKLSEQEADVLRTLARVRDRVYGRAGTLGIDASPQERAAAQILRGWRNLVASAKLGGTALTGGVQDLYRVVAQYGFAPTFGRLARLAASPAFRQLSRANARRMGVAVEVALARRVMVAADGAITEGWTQRLAERVFKVSGLNHVTDMWRTLSATLIEDRILKAASDVAGGHSLDDLLKARLARIGIDEQALRDIHHQASAHGADLEGVRVSGSMNWTDASLAETYESAILRESRLTVMQPGAADRTWWADGEIGKTLGQIKSFSLAAPVRLTMEPAQLIGHGRYLAAARFLGAMMVGGYLVHVFRQLAAGAVPTTDPAGAAGEAFSESGLAGVLPDIASPFARRFGIFGESARFSDRNVTGAFGGPAVGTAADAYDVLFNRTQGGLSASDLRAIRRLLPFQNLWWARRAINALEGETAEALELPGADSANFLERAAQTQELRPTAQRGGTGTGQGAY